MLFTAFILDVIANTIYPARITIENGIFKEVTPITINESFSVDFPGLMMPGFIDSHIHIESSMVSPAQFARVAVRHGTTSVVCDPHEIANVLGIEGVEAMIENASKVPFETSGAVLDSDAIKYLLKKDEVVALGEMMNFPGVINGDEEVHRKLELARAYGKPIDGHAPLVTRGDLDKYLAAGISTDHECSNVLEALEKKVKGMKIMVRDGSSALNMEGLFDIEEGSKSIDFSKYNNMLLRDIFENGIYSPLFDFIVSDDKHPNDLIKGHLNLSVRKAFDLGIDLLKAISMVTINPSYHYGLNCGAIIPGAQADFIIVDSIHDLNVLQTYVGGECVFDGENVLFDAPKMITKNTVKASKKTPEDFDIHYDGDECEVNVIECFDGELLTKKATAKLSVKDGVIQPDIYQDVLKIAASSIAHDSHNIIVIGYNSQMMADAVNQIIDDKGGIAVVSEDFSDSLPLPIAGLMSNEDVYEVADKLGVLHKMASSLGCQVEAPFMTMAFMALLVIPSIKISDKGLFDGDNFEFMDVVIE